MIRYASAYRETIPEHPFYMVGYVNPIRDLPGIGIKHAPLVIASLLEIQNETILFLSFDVCMVKQEQSERIKEYIHLLYPNLHKDHMVLSAIHTHSGPDGLGMSYPDAHPNINYFNTVCNAIRECIDVCMQTLCDVQVFAGSIVSSGFYGNRNDKSLPYNDEIQMLLFKHEDKVVGSMLSIGCHSTVLGEYNPYCSYDLLGSVRNLVAQDLGCMPYTFMSSAGDVSVRNYRKGSDFKELERISIGLYKQIKEMKNFEQVELSKFESVQIHYPIAYDNEQYYPEYIQQLEQIRDDLRTSLDPLVIKLRTTEKKKLELKLSEKQIDFEVKVTIFKLSDIKIIAFPGELVSSFGKLLKEACAVKCPLVITCANDHLGYFVEEAYYGKTYETKATYIPKGEVEKIMEVIKKQL